MICFVSKLFRHIHVGECEPNFLELVKYLVKNSGIPEFTIELLLSFDMKWFIVINLVFSFISTLKSETVSQFVQPNALLRNHST